MGRFAEWLRDEWRPLALVIGLAAIGGFAGSSAMLLWFYQGVCWQ